MKLKQLYEDPCIDQLGVINTCTATTSTRKELALPTTRRELSGWEMNTFTHERP
jgi:hypothetical protein